LAIPGRWKAEVLAARADVNREKGELEESRMLGHECESIQIWSDPGLQFLQPFGGPIKSLIALAETETNLLPASFGNTVET
jgi:hypothetical protein